jgi:hypothetical protein
MKPSNQARALPAELTAELAALPPFSTYDEAVHIVNGSLGERVGIRGKYLRRLNALAAPDPYGVLALNIAKEINTACDNAIAKCAPIQCHSKRWSSLPRSY